MKNSVFERIHDGMGVFFYWFMSLFLRFVPAISTTPPKTQKVPKKTQKVRKSKQKCSITQTPISYPTQEISLDSDSDSENHFESENLQIPTSPKFESRIRPISNQEDSEMGTFQKSIRNQTDVALNIAKLLFSKKYSEDKNVVFSPLSIHTVLSIIAAGSDGHTLNQLLTFLRCESIDDLNSLASKLASDVLHDSAPDDGNRRPCKDRLYYSDSDDGECEGPSVCFANSMWVEQSFSLQHSFKQLLATDYKATLASVDLQNNADEVVNEVNLWVEEKTKGLIKNFLPPDSLDSLTRLVFANSLYFKAAWVCQEDFDASETKDYDFHTLYGTSVKVPFMTSTQDRYICVCDGFKVLKLPYESGLDTRRFSMYIFLPDAKDGLSALVEHLASESGLLEHHLPHTKVEVRDFRIPKFKFSFGVDLPNVLKEMGLVLPFSPCDADLTKMVDPLMCQENLYVSNIKHKSFISMNEEGRSCSSHLCRLYGVCLGL